MSIRNFLPHLLPGGGSLKARTFTDTVAIPMEVVPGTRPIGGVFRPTGRHLKIANYKRRGKPRLKPPHGPDLSPPARLEGEYIFGGYVIDQYGHFLLDSIARLWFTRTRPDLPIVWLHGERFTGDQQAIIDVLGVANPHIFVTEPTKIDVLHIPPPGFEIGGDFHPEHAAFLGRYRPKGEPSGERLWLSRSRLSSPGGRVLDQEEIEAEIAARGWTIYHPQEDPLPDQLDRLGNAAALAGFVGSAFHSLVLLEAPRAPVTLFAEDRPRNGQYDTIARMKGFEQEIVIVCEKVEGRRRRWNMTVPDRAPIYRALDGMRTSA